MYINFHNLKNEQTGWNSRAKVCIFLIIALLLSSSCPSFGGSKSVFVTIPSFEIKLNGIQMEDVQHVQYPPLLYNGITYIPMTYYQAKMLNLDTDWTNEKGLVIKKGNPTEGKIFAFETKKKDKNKKKYSTSIFCGKVSVNDKRIDNAKEPYPLLSFRDVTYFPLTWRFAHDEFGWEYEFNSKEGLSIYADNFFYTMNGDSSIEGTSYMTVSNETHYICGDLRIHMSTETQRLLGPISGNLQIISGEKEITPKGYFGYYQKNGPLFTVEDGFINTVYYTNPDKRDVKPCKVQISDGEIIEDVQLFHE